MQNKSKNIIIGKLCFFCSSAKQKSLSPSHSLPPLRRGQQKTVEEAVSGDVEPSVSSAFSAEFAAH